MDIRPYDPDRDKEAVRRMWQAHGLVGGKPMPPAQRTRNVSCAFSVFTSDGSTSRLESKSCTGLSSLRYWLYVQWRS